MMQPLPGVRNRGGGGSGGGRGGTALSAVDRLAEAISELKLDVNAADTLAEQGGRLRYVSYLLLYL